jgi:hypothetical protein
VCVTPSLLKKVLPVIACGSVLLGVAPASAQSIALPGTIEIENFDQGAAGVAYSDSTGGNSGGQYRATDVDIEATADSTGAFNIGWVYPGEWLKYTVNVPAAGAYAFEFRVAAPTGGGGTFHIEANGVNVTGPVSIPSTGGWQTWTTVTRSAVNLSAGSQPWKLVIDATGASGFVGNLNYIRVTGPAAAAGSTPYTGTPVSLPGMLQIENFDNGGEGVAYHDTSNGNEGGQYRPEGVDVEASSDTGGGYHAAYAFAGEWLAHTVNVASAGNYDIEARVASNGSGGTFHIEINGVDRTGPFTVPNTGGWGTWTTIRKTGLALSAGRQVWRLVMDTNGPTTAVGNLNYLRVSAGSGAAPFGGTPVALPGTVQLENFDNGVEGVAFHDLSPSNEGGQYRTTGVDIEPTTDAGGGYHLGWVFAGEWLRYSVNVTTAGTYDIEMRVASNGTGGTFHLEVNGVDRTGPFSVPNTGGWQTWTTLRRTGLALNAGPQVFRLVMDTNGPTTAVANLNYLRVVNPTAANQPPSVSITRPTGGATFTAPANIAVDATASDDGSVSRVDFYAGTQLIGTDATAPYSVTWGNVAAGSYSLTAVAFDNAGASTASAAVAVTVGGTTPAPATPTAVAFTPSPDHASGVTSYSVIIYRASGGTQAATTSLGKPAPVNNEIRVDISAIVNPLPAGSYYAVVRAHGATGTSTSAASASFTK